MTPPSDATLLLTNRIAPVDAEPFKPKEYWSLTQQLNESELLALSQEEIDERVGNGDQSRRISRLIRAAGGFALARERLESTGIHLLSHHDSAYPSRLKEQLDQAAPPMIYAAGPIEWLEASLIGVVGSRSVDPKGAEVARQAAQIAANGQMGIVSGGARGVDLMSMTASAEAGIPSVGIIPEGLDRAGRRHDLRAAVGEERLCLVSPYPPTAGFSAGNAMGRNKLIYAMAQVTLVVASDHCSGGTWGGATDALRRGLGPVAIWTGEGAGPGNMALVDNGGIPIDDLNKLLELANEPVNASDRSRSTAPVQLGLDLA